MEQSSPIKNVKVTPLDVLRSFWRGMKPYWYLYIITVICISITAFVQVYNPLLYKQFFDVLTNTSDRGVASAELITILIKILGFNAILWICYRIATFTDNYSTSRTSMLLRQQAFNYLIDHSYGFFSNSFSGALVQRINRYIRAFGQLMDQLTWSVLSLFLNIIGILIVLWRTKPLFAWIVLVWMLVFILFNFFFSRFKAKYDLASAEADSHVTAYLSDTITNHMTVQLFTGKPHEVAEFNDVTLDQTKKAIFAWNLAGVVDSVQASLIFIIEFFVFYYAVRYWREGIFTVGTFILLQSYIIGLGDRLWGFSRIVRAVYQGYADSKEMVQTMKLDHEIQDAPGAQPLQVSRGEIIFDHLSFSFNKNREVLKDISLTINGGEKVALIGPSGAGKSTFVKLLLRQYETQPGSICIDGQHIQKVTVQSLRENLSLVPQDPVLFHRSLKENIRYGNRNASDEEVLAAAKLAHCDEFIKDLPLGYDTLVGERGIKLSGGERQRVAIARAILKNAPILILDEATSSLDSESEHLIQDALETLMKGKTVVVIAHRLSTIRKMDRIIVLENGKIREEGSHQSLLADSQSLYAKLWNLQAGGFLKETEE